MPVIPNIIISVRGEPKSGKTHFAFSFPGPIYCVSLDMRARLIAAKFPNKEIDVREYVCPIASSTDDKAIIEGTLAVYGKIASDYQKALESGKYKTFVIDPETSLWEILRTAYAEERDIANNPINPRKGALEYTQPNRRMSTFFDNPRVQGSNIVATSYLKEKYKGGSPTGEYILEGWKYTDSKADIIFDLAMVGEKEKAKTEFTVVGCGFDRSLRGSKFDDLSYKRLMALLGVDVDNTPRTPKAD